MDMKLKDTDYLKNEAENIGMAELAMLSAINYLSASKFGIDGLITLQEKIKSIESSLWVLVPLAIKGNVEIFNDQFSQLKKSIDNYSDAILLLRNINETNNK
jgi:hypothetical protein